MEHIKRLCSYLIRHNYLDFLSDEASIRIMWWTKNDKSLDLVSPTGFNEKLNWLKLHDRNPKYTILSDKIRVRDFIKERIGEKYLIPLIGTWKNPEEIDFDSMPNQYILKCNHNSGEGMFVVKDKDNINREKVIRGLKKALKKNYYYSFREWPYKDIKPLVICEEYIEDDDPDNTTGNLIDYKFYCFNGEPKFLYISSANISDNKKNDLLKFMDFDWKEAPFYRPDHPRLDINIKKPEAFEEMIWIAGRLSAGIPFARIDLYYVRNRVYFSEISFYPGGGVGLFSPSEWETKIGDLIDLSLVDRKDI